MSGFQLNLKQSLIDEDRKRRNRTIDPSEAPQAARRRDQYPEIPTKQALS